MLSFAASRPHRQGVEMGGEERPSGMRDEERRSSCNRLPFGVAPPGLLSWQSQPEPEACRGGDLSLPSPAPLLPPPWLYKAVITKPGNQLLPCFPRSISGPHSRGRGKRASSLQDRDGTKGIGGSARGLGIQHEPSQQGPPGLGKRQVPGINIYFLTSWC